MGFFSRNFSSLNSFPIYIIVDKLCLFRCLGQDFVNQFYPTCTISSARANQCGNVLQNTIRSIGYKLFLASVTCAMLWFTISKNVNAVANKNNSTTIITNQTNLSFLIEPFPIYVGIFLIDLCYILTAALSERCCSQSAFWR